VAVGLVPFLVAWRTTPLHDREVIDALVDPAYAGPPESPELAAALRNWPGTYYWSDEGDGRHLILTRPIGRWREAWMLHVALFLVVLLLVTSTGAVIVDALPAAFWSWSRERLLSALPSGLPFSLPLIAILLCHELGHYLTARHYQLNVSPPFFIPGSPPPFGIGTFGAFIRLRTIVNDRRQLLDVGAAGPIAGFAVALPVLWLGMTWSHPTAPVNGHTGLSTPFGMLGQSPITLLVGHFIWRDVSTVALHPVAIAGWFGMFITMLNLLPMAQLDGGHILYAAFPNWHRRVARLFWVLTIGLAWLSRTWLIWGVLVLLLSRGRLDHPPVLDAYRPLPRSRLWMLVISLVLLVLTFAPVPIRQ